MSWRSHLLVLFVWQMSICGAQMPCARDPRDVQPMKFTITDRKCCLEWESDSEKNRDKYIDWQMELHPYNSGIKEQILRPNPEDSSLEEELCFDIPSFPNQKYDLKLSCSFADRLEPWRDDYNALTFSTPPAVPFRPPQFVPNGFFHNQEKKQLQVLWIQLNELEFNGPNFSYTVTTDTGNGAVLLSKNSAWFHDWDATRSSVVSIWSQNSLGLSENSSQIKVPILTQSINHQPQQLRYHEDNFTVSWQAPQDQKDLIGYVVSWCFASKNSSLICDDHKAIHYKELDESYLQFKFVKPIKTHNVAVAAKYKDGFSGGTPQIVTTRLVTTSKVTSSLRLIFYIGISVFIFLFLLCLILAWVRNFHKSPNLPCPTIF